MQHRNLDDIDELEFKAAMLKLSDDLAFDIFMAWLTERCYATRTTLVPGDHAQTYANEHLRELYLEIYELVSGSAFVPVPQPKEVNDHAESHPVPRDPARWNAFGRFFRGRK